MNTNSTEKACHQINEMISGYLDNELTQQQRQLVSLHLESCETCQQTVKDLEQIKQAIKGSEMPEMEIDRIDAIMSGSASSALQTFAWSMFIIGLGILLAFVVLEFMFASSTSTSEKIVSSLIWGGLIGVFLSVVRQQWTARKTDKYKGVKL
jgi:hypothetical protein